MAVLIPNMEMPQNCLLCPCSALNPFLFSVTCEALVRTADHDTAQKGRMMDCPLVEIPITKAPMTDKELEECNFEL